MTGEIVEVPQPLDQTYRPSAGYASWHHARLAKKDTARWPGCMSPGQGDIRVAKRKSQNPLALLFRFVLQSLSSLITAAPREGQQQKVMSEEKKSRVLDRV